MNKIVYREIQFSSVTQSCLTLCNALDRQGYIYRVVKILTQCSLKQFETFCDDTDRCFSRKTNQKKQNLSVFTGELREKPAAQPIILEAGLSSSLIHWHRVKFSRSAVSDSLRPHGLQHQASLSITNSRCLLKLRSTESGFRNSLDGNAGTKAWAPCWNLTDMYPAPPTHAWELRLGL